MGQCLGDSFRDFAAAIRVAAVGAAHKILQRAASDARMVVDYSIVVLDSDLERLLRLDSCQDG